MLKPVAIWFVLPQGTRGFSQRFQRKGNSSRSIHYFFGLLKAGADVLAWKEKRLRQGKMSSLFTNPRCV